VAAASTTRGQLSLDLVEPLRMGLDDAAAEALAAAAREHGIEFVGPPLE
jgi:hypothetical protein